MDKFEKTFLVFKKYYKPIPLEAFGKNPYKILISVLLSSRTLDTTTHKAASRLFERAPNVKKLASLDEKTLRKLIYPVGFYNTKSRHLKELSEMIISEFGGKIPQRISDLVLLPGVGRKTANLVINRAFEKPAIAVDTHVHRITNLLGWVKSRTPQETERVLEKILPLKYWTDTNRLFVSIGQQYRGKKLKHFLYINKLL